GARVAKMTASISRLTSENRRARKVSGSAAERPDLAAMKPDDHSSTKSAGMAAADARDGAAAGAVIAECDPGSAGGCGTLAAGVRQRECAGLRAGVRR